jgi:hypothetical protein
LGEAVLELAYQIASSNLGRIKRYNTAVELIKDMRRGQWYIDEASCRTERSRTVPYSHRWSHDGARPLGTCSVEVPIARAYSVKTI